MKIVWERLNAVAHPCNPSIWKAKVGRLPDLKEFEASLGNGETLFLQKVQKPDVVICTCSPSYSEAEAGELLEPRRRRLR